jgi:hypothetical protein
MKYKPVKGHSAKFQIEATFSVFESPRKEHGYSVGFELETGDYFHLSGPWPDVKTAAEHMADLLEKRGLKEPK